MISKIGTLTLQKNDFYKNQKDGNLDVFFENLKIEVNGIHNNSILFLKNKNDFAEVKITETNHWADVLQVVHENDITYFWIDNIETQELLIESNENLKTRLLTLLNLKTVVSKIEENNFLFWGFYKTHRNRIELRELPVDFYQKINDENFLGEWINGNLITLRYECKINEKYKQVNLSGSEAGWVFFYLPNFNNKKIPYTQIDFYPDLNLDEFAEVAQQINIENEEY